MKSIATLYLPLLAFATLAFADGPLPPEAQFAQLKKIADELHYQQGEITLKGGLAKVRVPSDFRYLDGKDASTVITKIWGNPPGAQPLGMLMPADCSPLDPDSWAVIISYEEDGYVKDDDAAKINYSELLSQMQEGAREANKLRAKQGYPAVELVGWATPPHYDKDSHKLYWAKELKFEGSDASTLNYNIRALGRRGVLVLNAVSSMDQLKEIEGMTPAILGMVDFQEGHRYADFTPGTDKVATYGLAGLVAGGVLAKAGFFKGLIAAVLALKKFAIVGIVIAYAGLKALWTRLRGPKEQTEPPLIG